MRNIVSFSRRSSIKVPAIAFSLVLFTALSGAFQPARADNSDWISLLKPLVQEVVMPVVKQRVAHWQSRMEEKLIGQAPVVEAISITPSPVTPPVASPVTTVDTPQTSQPSAETSSTGWVWQSPEAP